MKTVITTGRVFYASYGLVLGIQNFIFGTFIATIMPVPKWMATNTPMAYIVGTIVFIISISIVIKMKGQFSATLLSVFYFLVLFILHFPKIVTDIKNPAEWTAVAEIVCLSAGGIIAATLMTTDIWELYGLAEKRERIRRIAAFVFGAALLVFAALHFMYAEFISYLIPDWIPAREFFAYFVGVAFFAAAFAIFVKVLDEIALYLLGSMFLLWVLIEHAPRVFVHPENRDEWSSLFIALAMSGISFMLASSVKNKISEVDQPA